MHENHGPIIVKIFLSRRKSLFMFPLISSRDYISQGGVLSKVQVGVNKWD